MAISKSTPYVRYKKDFTSSLHLGTIHIESEYLDRTQKTTIESIHGMTWHNKVVNENKELNLLSDTQLELTELEKQYWNTGEKRVSVDEIHTLEEVEPNEDGTYTYTVNSMEGEYIEIYDGINNITSTSDGLDGQFEIVYDTTEEDISGNIALDQVAQQYEITDSGVGAITGAKSTGLTLVNHITEPSKEEVVAIQEYEGQYFTIENTVQGNIKSAILKGQTLVNLVTQKSGSFNGTRFLRIPFSHTLKTNTKYFVKFNLRESSLTDGVVCRLRIGTNGSVVGNLISDGIITVTDDGYNTIEFFIRNADDVVNGLDAVVDDIMLIEYQGDIENWDIPYFEGMKSVQMPVLTTVGKNLFNPCVSEPFNMVAHGETDGSLVGIIPVKPNTTYTLSVDKDVTKGRFIAKMSPILLTERQVPGFMQSSVYKYLIDNYANGRKFEYTLIGGPLTFTTLPDCHYIYVNVDRGHGTVAKGEILVYDKMSLVESPTSTPYEAFKSNILTVNEEVELRKVGNVQDELNLLTGELTQRVGEIVLDGSESWIKHGAYSTDEMNVYWTYNKFIPSISKATEIVCDKLPVLNPTVPNSIRTNGEGGIFIGLPSEVNITSFLQSDPVTVQYPFTTESVKTVDLTVQNQDDNTIPHIQTQQGITHVSTSSDGLTPVVEMSCSYDTIIKPNTTYTIKLDRPIVSDTMYLQIDLGGTMMMLDADVNAFTIKTPSTLSHSQLRLSGTGNTVKEIIVLEGNRVNDKIEYFEGMENVENPILVVSNCPYVFGKGGRL